jgi:small-conductance mechanosensitive channel
MACGIWTILGLGLAVGLPFFSVLTPLSAAVAWISWLQGAASIAAAGFTAKGVTGFVQRLSEARGWSQQRTVLLKLAIKVALYLLGGSVALSFFGMTWQQLATSLSATSIALGWGAAGFIGNLIQGFYILVERPFSVGDIVEIGGARGEVEDMNLSYVVFKHPEETHTLVPYALINKTPFKVLSNTVAQGASR